MPKIMKADPGYADLDDERIERAVDVAGFDRCALARGEHETRSCPPFDAASLVAEQCSGGNPLVASWAAVYSAFYRCGSATACRSSTGWLLR